MPRHLLGLRCSPLISKMALQIQLGAPPPNFLELTCSDAIRHPPLEHQPALELAHKTLWADHGDDIARFYAGTPAMHSDVTRLVC